jgi:hypothetical protein
VPEPGDLASALAAIGPRAACSDAERRAGRLVAGELRSAGLRPRTETLWLRPQRSVAVALACALGIAGSVVSADHPETGLALALAALLSFLGEWTGRAPLLRRLTRERATQNVVSRIAPAGEPASRVLLTAGLDVARRGVMTRWRVPAPMALAAVALAAVVAAAAARVAGAEGTALGAVQLVPTVVLILLVGGFLDDAYASPPAGIATATGAAAATAAAAALAKEPPARVAVDVVLAGASPAGLRHWARTHRGEGPVTVLHLADCSGDSASATPGRLGRWRGVTIEAPEPATARQMAVALVRRLDAPASG